MNKWLFILLLTIPAGLWAQQPKMYLKVFAGGNSHRKVYRERDVQSDFFPGWQGGFGFRVSRRRAFAEVDFNFIRFTARIPGEDLDLEDDLRFKFNSFELPLTAGWIPIKEPLVKWYLYSGLVNRFNGRIRARFEDEELDFKPKDAGLPVYNLGFRLGSQVDVAMLNLDFSYTINLTNGVRDVIRTNVHAVLFNVGFVF